MIFLHHDITLPHAVLHAIPVTPTDELDSYMYQSVGHMGVEMYAEAVGVPLFRRVIQGSSLNTTSITYHPTEGDEVEDLYLLLKEVQVWNSVMEGLGQAVVWTTHFVVVLHGF